MNSRVPSSRCVLATANLSVSFIRGVLLLRPYFKSVFGTKTTKVSRDREGRTANVANADAEDEDSDGEGGGGGLEEGEGRGPLLEYFGLVGAQMQDQGTAELFAYHQGTEALWFGSDLLR